MLSTMFTNDVRQTLDQFRRSVDQMFESFYGQSASASSNSSGEEWNGVFSPALESGWNDHYLTIRAILPGVSEKDVRVTVQNNQLVIEGERKAPEAFQKNAFMHIPYGKFHVAANLPKGLDVDRISCRLQNGMLDIQLPIAEASKPRQVQILTGEERKAIHA